MYIKLCETCCQGTFYEMHNDFMGYAEWCKLDYEMGRSIMIEDVMTYHWTVLLRHAKVKTLGILTCNVSCNQNYFLSTRSNFVGLCMITS